MFRLFRKVTLDEVVRSVAQAVPESLGDQLVSLVLHGTHVDSISNEVVEPEAPVAILIMIRALDHNTLRDLSNVFQQSRLASRLAMMVMSMEELHASTDVFPITFLEIKRRYRVLAGEDVLSELSISDSHLRLRCEQELKNLLLRMQSTLLLQCQRPRLLLLSLKRSHTAFIRAIRASLGLIDDEIPDRDHEVTQRVSEAFGLDGEVLQRVLECCRGDARIGRDAISEVYASFLTVVHRAAKAIDALPDEVAVIEATAG